MIRAAELDGVEGLISAETGLKLCELATQSEHAIVEIGSHRGRSTCYLAEGARLGNGATVYAVDPWDKGKLRTQLVELYDPAHRLAFHANLERLGLSDYVEAVQGFSTEVAETWHRSIGLLFVDGWHSYDAIRADVEAWTPHLVSGGYLAIDDYRNRRCPDVTRYVDEVLRPSLAWVDWDLSTPGVRPGSRLAVGKKL